MRSKAFYNELDELFEPGALMQTQETHWLRKGQKLFRAPTAKTPENARAVIHWLNSEHSFGLKDSTFKEAGELLTEAVLQGGDGTDPDRFTFPIIYLYRHATELLLKEVVRSGQHLGMIPNDAAVTWDLNAHALYPLWSHAKIAIASLPGPVQDLQVAETLISELHHADPDGQSLRYETNKKGRRNVVKLPPTVDLIHLRRMFQGLWGFLEASAGMLSDARSAIE